MLGVDAEHREHPSGDEAFFNSFYQLLFGEGAVFKKYLHQRLFALGSFFDQLGLQLFGSLFFALGDVEFLWSTSVFRKLVEFHFQQVDHLIETQTRIHGILTNRYIAAKLCMELADSFVEVGFFVLQMVDGKNHRRIVTRGVSPTDFGTYLHTVLCVDHHYACVGNFECRDYLAHKIVEARGVDDVNFFAAKFGIEHCGRYGVFAFVFYFAVVGNGVFVVNASSSVYQSSLEDHAFGKCGFSGLGAANERDVPDFVSLIYFHGIRSKKI